MKVLVVSHEYPPHGGGAGVVALQTCEQLFHDGVDVTLITRKTPEMSVLQHPFKINALQVHSKFWFLSYFRQLTTKSYDIVLLNDPAAIYMAGLYLSKPELAKCICFLHGSEPEYIFESPKFMKKISFFKFFYVRAIRRCKVIISPSKYMKDKFLHRTSVGPIAQRIVPVYYGVDAELFYPTDFNHLKKIFSLEDKLVLLSVSRIQIKKGYLKKYEVFKELINRGLNIAWLIVGGGEFESDFRDLVQREGYGSHIIFVGRVDREQLRDYYSLADVFWLLSEYDESFGLVYVEAQLCGLPCIGYRRAGVVEAITEHVSGYLVSDASECVDLFMGGDFKSMDKNTIIKQAKLFSVRNYINTLYDLIGYTSPVKKCH